MNYLKYKDSNYICRLTSIPVKLFPLVGKQTGRILSENLTGLSKRSNAENHKIDHNELQSHKSNVTFYLLKLPMSLLNVDELYPLCGTDRSTCNLFVIQFF